MNRGADLARSLYLELRAFRLEVAGSWWISTWTG
jgi:hypothetical protein